MIKLLINLLFVKLIRQKFSSLSLVLDLEVRQEKQRLLSKHFPFFSEKNGLK